MIRFQSIFTSFRFKIPVSGVRTYIELYTLFASKINCSLPLSPVIISICPIGRFSEQSLFRCTCFNAVLCQKKDDTRYGCHPVVFDIHVYYSIIDIELSKSNGALRFFHDASPAAGSSTENSSPLPFSSTVTRQPSMISPLMIITARRFSTLFCRYRLIGLAP